MWPLLLQQQWQQKEEPGGASLTFRTRQKHRRCDSSESPGNWRANLWQDEGWWRQLFQEAGGMWTCCGLYLPRATAAGLDQATAFSFHFIAFIPPGVDGWRSKPQEEGWGKCCTVSLQFKCSVVPIFFLYVIFNLRGFRRLPSYWPECNEQIKQERACIHCCFFRSCSVHTERLQISKELRHVNTLHV